MERDIKIIEIFFTRLAKKYGNSIHSLAWESDYTQRMRFNVFTEIAPLEGMSVLDVGCGKADYYDYFLRNNIDVEYFGVDCSAEMIRIAKKLHPEINVFYRDFFNEAHYPEIDYAFASGVANVTTPDNKNYMESMIRKMYSLARKGVGVNMLSSHAPDSGNEAGIHFYVPEKLLNFALSITPDVILRHDYLPNDFTLYLYKKR
jgi:ubiquinone/menaquinone biosynthesis C-methylase UbiE